MIDLRSDTCSRPSAAMRQAMARAEVGDDVYGDDPTVRALEWQVAQLLGKEAALFLPTGTMANQVALRAHTEPGDAVLLEQSAHIYLPEGGGPAALSGIWPRLLPGVRGLFGPGDIDAALGAAHPFFPKTLSAPATLLCVENTHNGGGGAVWPLAAIDAVALHAKARGLRSHLDGARLWHASAASGVPERDYARHFDSVSVCFSKALGGPVGSCLAGSADFIERARRFRQQMGGGMRQAGVIAAGALFALREHRQRLVETHAAAQSFAQALAGMRHVELDPALVETNIVRFNLKQLAAAPWVEQAHRCGLYLLPAGPRAVRAVFYLDIKAKQVEQAIAILRPLLEQGSHDEALAAA